MTVEHRKKELDEVIQVTISDHYWWWFVLMGREMVTDLTGEGEHVITKLYWSEKSMSYIQLVSFVEVSTFPLYWNW